MCETIENVQYKAALAITCAIKQMFYAKLYKELGLETLNLIWLCRRLCILYKVNMSDLPLYLSKNIPD